jgi:hypothetical protein
VPLWQLLSDYYFGDIEWKIAWQTKQENVEKLRERFAVHAGQSEVDG